MAIAMNMVRYDHNAPVPISNPYYVRWIVILSRVIHDTIPRYAVTRLMALNNVVTFTIRSEFPDVSIGTGGLMWAVRFPWSNLMRIFMNTSSIMNVRAMVTVSNHCAIPHLANFLVVTGVLMTGL